MRPADNPSAWRDGRGGAGGWGGRRAHVRGPSKLPIKAPCVWSSAGSGAGRPLASRGLIWSRSCRVGELPHGAYRLVRVAVFWVWVVMAVPFGGW
jgi:hypothetical protein